MAETSREGGDSPSESGIPSGLNRIRTRRVPSKDRLISKSDDLDAETMVEPQMAAPGSGNGLPRPRSKQQMAEGRHLKITDRKEGFRKGKKIARWFTSYLSKDSNQDIDDILPSAMVSNSEVKSFDKNVSAVTKKHGKQKQSTGKRSSPERIQKKKVPKGVKSFSHELGPKGGIRPSHPRAHSYNDLKELIGSLKSRFDSAKEVVNTELANFSVDIMDVLEGNDGFYSEGQEMEENLLILAQQCAEMTSSEFRDRCEGIVQDLADKRQRCQTEVLKQLFTRMLFILTRCTRLLQFDKDSVPIDENSLHKFKQCLERIPAVEMSWLPKPGIDDSGSVCSLNQRHDYQHLRALEEPLSESDATCQKESTVLAQKSTFQNLQDFCSSESSITGSDFQSTSAAQRKKTLSSYQENVLQTRNLIHKDACSSLHEQERTSDVSDSVICRICEEIVPASRLESHSYICAFADKCDFAYSDVDERLFKLAEVLDQIIDSCSLNFHASQNSPEISRTQLTNSAVGSGGQSPKASEWQTRGLEGLFEDIHEMDTACIDDSYLSTSGNMKGHFGIKLGHYGAPSSTGSLTSVSSTNTPRASHFGVFWLEHNNYYEPEDIQQMTDLGDIARCVANTDIAKEGASEYLLACMQDLQDILQHSKLKALVIDTFGSRIENLLREKYLLACELMDNRSPKSESKSKEGIGCLVDSPSQSSTMSTPLHPAHKERTTIDDFEIIKPISRGAFGKVFLARKRTTGDLFAIKVLKKLDMIRKNDIERILAERNILITVRNPFVVRFFYSFTCRDNLYLVMEYLNGGDLYSLLRKVGCLEEDVARIYIAELVLALEYLHSLGIVHRDLKPDNILIAHDGHIKLTDFGLSKIGLINSTVDLSGSEINGATPSDDHDQHGSFNSAHQTDERSQRSAVGTPDYLAPEILLGTEHGYAADWWSVGIILFELITGIPPFNAERPEIIFDNILNRKIPWPLVPNDMSYQAQDLINRFLVHNPDQRLGANGSSEVKAHPFFAGVNWDTLALQKVAFIPNPDGADDTSYFMSRYSQISIGIPEDQNCSDSASDTASCSNSGIEMDECGDMAEFDSCPLNLSLINFSFKNLSQLASINYDVLLQSGKDPSKCSSPSKGPDS